MANILLLSVSGSPGVTNTTLSMTMTWPNPAMLAEASTRIRSENRSTDRLRTTSSWCLSAFGIR